MHELKLHYFDFDGGRGEPARLAMHLGGIPFEDRRIPMAEWPSVRDQMPYHALPVLDVDGQDLAQSNTINRFVGELAGLYPGDPWQAALCDEVMDAVEDIAQKIVPTMFIQNDDEKRAARLELVDGPIPLYLERLQSRLERAGGQYFSDDRLTVADLKVFVWIRHLTSGVLDHIPMDLPERLSPALLEHMDRVGQEPKIEEYYATRGK